MGADLTTLLVEEIGFRRFERPVETAFFGLTSVNLNAIRDKFEHWRRTWGRCYGGLIGNGGNGARAEQNCHRNSWKQLFHLRLRRSRSSAEADCEYRLGTLPQIGRVHV